jgi:hypothetical protein
MPGGPSEADERDRKILALEPGCYPLYFDGRGKFRISKAVEYDLKLKQQAHTISALVESFSKLEALLEQMREWKQGGASKARGRLRGSKKKAVSTSSS